MPVIDVDPVLAYISRIFQGLWGGVDVAHSRSWTCISVIGRLNITRTKFAKSYLSSAAARKFVSATLMRNLIVHRLLRWPVLGWFCGLWAKLIGDKVFALIRWSVMDRRARLLLGRRGDGRLYIIIVDEDFTSPAVLLVLSSLASIPQRTLRRTR